MRDLFFGWLVRYDFSICVVEFSSCGREGFSDEVVIWDYVWGRGGYIGVCWW